MKKFKRIFVIVMDSFGAGHAKDGAAYGDDGADTMGHIAEKHEDPKSDQTGTCKSPSFKGSNTGRTSSGLSTGIKRKKLW